jgi:hypothetical protein
VILEQDDVLVYCLVQSQVAHELVHGTDSAKSDGSGLFSTLVPNIRVPEHRAGLIVKPLSIQPGFEIPLVSEEDFVVSFIRLKCAPFGCDRNLDNAHHNLN